MTLWLFANDPESQARLRAEVAPIYADNSHPDCPLKSLPGRLRCNESLRVLLPVPLTEYIVCQRAHCLHPNPCDQYEDAGLGSGRGGLRCACLAIIPRVLSRPSRHAPARPAQGVQPHFSHYSFIAGPARRWCSSR
ncbi:hypothetical protein B0H10DRAFT_2044295 [Mycena sp. CBHHK59/15]|nr:hypothetical protein B0H10DRAFT_2044295 [Mycena sp. CBHHK59/15]